MKGRSTELAQLDAVLRDMREPGAGRGRLVLVSGEPGIGKTALAREFLRRVGSGDRALPSRHGRCA